MGGSYARLAAAALAALAVSCGPPEGRPDAGLGEPAAADAGGEPSDENPAPAGWTCEARFWAEGWCDCGCGVLDEHDCDDATLESCVYNACPGDQRPDPWDTFACQPNFFSCNPRHVTAEQLPRRHPLPEPTK